jgi:hypothetical protein
MIINEVIGSKGNVVSIFMVEGWPEGGGRGLFGKVGN